MLRDTQPTLTYTVTKAHTHKKCVMLSCIIEWLDDTERGQTDTHEHTMLSHRLDWAH